MEFARVMVPAAPVRRKPDHRKEMVSQLLFGEAVRILKSRNTMWVKVRSLHDRYEGWMTTSLLQIVDKEEALQPVDVVVTDLLGVLTMGGSTWHIPAGSSLPGFEAGRGLIAGRPFSYDGSFLLRSRVRPDTELVTRLSRSWLQSPYLWGGRTPLGVDCSGFVQVIFKTMGIDLPRDAWQQAKKGSPVKKFADARPGDLLFFDNTEDIVHVGILMEEGQMIHASGKVKLDPVSKRGLLDAEGRPVYGLSCVRRFW